jgi:3-oxoadipate enol-lactonase
MPVIDADGCSLWVQVEGPERAPVLVLSNSLGASLHMWEFRARAPESVAPMKAMLAATPIEGYIACCEAIRDMDHRDILARIAAPTLIVAGRQDQATPVAAAQFITVG